MGNRPIAGRTSAASEYSVRRIISSTEIGVIRLVRIEHINIGGLSATDRDDDIAANRDRISGDDLHAIAVESDIADEIDGAVGPDGVKLQNRIGGDHTAADGQHAVIAQSAHFDDVGEDI